MTFTGARDSSAFSLHGEVALITGGGSGLGLEIARCMAQSGAKVVLTGRRGDVLASACESIGSAASFHIQDINRTEKAPDLINAVREEHGHLSILVNNAGTHLKKSAVDTTVDEFRSILDTHLLAAHALTAAALPHMKARKHGHVLFIASMASLFGIPNVLAYSAAKSAHLGMVRTLATEVSHEGVRINAIAPGWIHSPMMEKALNNDQERRDRILQRTPMHAFGQATDVGWAAVYLSSPAAQFVTGVTLPVDGGVSIGF